MHTLTSNLMAESLPPEAIDTSVFRVVLARMEAQAFEQIKNLGCLLKIVRVMGFVCRQIIVIEDYNWIVRTRAWILACPMRTAKVRALIGEAAIRLWLLRRDHGVLERDPPRPIDYHPRDEGYRADTRWEWADYALPRFAGGMFAPLAENKPPRNPYRPAVQNPRGAAPAVFWPKELGAETLPTTAPVRAPCPSRHRRDNARALDWDLARPIGRDPKPP